MVAKSAVSTVHSMIPGSFLNSDTSIDPGKVTVFACLIMRDEASNIERCFSNMSGLVDGYFVCDTGSLDSSVKVARDFIAASGKKGDVIEARWVNYGHNRNIILRRVEEAVVDDIEKKTGISLQKAINWREYQEIEEHRYYAFITDLDNEIHYTDEEREGPVSFDRSQLNKDAFFIESRRGGSRYVTNNLVRIDPLKVKRWHYYNSIHETIDNKDPWFSPTVPTLGGFYIDYGTSGFRSRDSNRSLKDIMLLSYDHKREPEDSRPVFYIAQSFSDARHYGEAYEWYMKRAAMVGTWVGERYVSYWRASQMLDRTLPGGDERYLNCLMKGYELRCNRREIVHDLISYYDNKKLYEVAWQLGKDYIDVVANPSYELLLDSNIDGYGFYEKLSLVAYYTGRYKESYDLSQKILACPRTPDNIRQNTMKNLTFILQYYRPASSV